MAYPVGIILYAILQFIAFLFVLVGTPIDMFRGTTKDLFNISLCITLWGSKFECKTIMYAMPTDDQWKFCPTRLQHFHIAQILSIISVFVYALAALLGFIMLCCCSLLRWLCLVFNIAGIITLGITWGFMVVEYGRNESRFCPLCGRTTSLGSALLFHGGLGPESHRHYLPDAPVANRRVR
ncbi:Amastin surface glycoprotein [Leishmania donovani]|uniref:Amastin_surface_glycoprotein_putative/Pfam:PF0734 4 n=1 Tax=Leishmania donovani TaxID=5661 RepID=A0A6J8F717_LEIDO|nr:Amastin surface glycoprotein [Leishmania donovani]VDZ42336.1 Amastin_surface_glycoprotein_putative/Pfam:PF07344 [Leishmania donovani]